MGLEGEAVTFWKRISPLLCKLDWIHLLGLHCIPQHPLGLQEGQRSWIMLTTQLNLVRLGIHGRVWDSRNQLMNPISDPRKMDAQCALVSGAGWNQACLCLLQGLATLRCKIMHPASCLCKHGASAVLIACWPDSSNEHYVCKSRTGY